jgi:hypothetical protein
VLDICNDVKYSIINKNYSRYQVFTSKIANCFSEILIKGLPGWLISELPGNFFQELGV